MTPLSGTVADSDSCGQIFRGGAAPVAAFKGDGWRGVGGSTEESDLRELVGVIAAGCLVNNYLAST
jgi:hypothetical protein